MAVTFMCQSCSGGKRSPCYLVMPRDDPDVTLPPTICPWRPSQEATWTKNNVMTVARVVAV